MPIEEITPLRLVRGLGERLAAGSEVPAGQCKHCESLVYVVKEFDTTQLAAKFAQLLVAIDEIEDIKWEDVVAEVELDPKGVQDLVLTARMLWKKVSWIYDNTGVENVIVDEEWADRQ